MRSFLAGTEEPTNASWPFFQIKLSGNENMHPVLSHADHLILNQCPSAFSVLPPLFQCYHMGFLENKSSSIHSARVPIRRDALCAHDCLVTP